MSALYNEFAEFLHAQPTPSAPTMQEFIRGQRAKLSQLAPDARRFVLDVRVQSAGAVFDFVCFGIDDKGQLADDRFMVFFNCKAAPDDAITLDELTEKSARFGFDLAKVPATIARLVFTLSVDGAGAMRDLGPSELTLSADGNAIARYKFSGQDFDKEGALMLAEVYRKDGAWRLWASGQGFAGDLGELLRHFGGQEEGESAPNQTAVATQNQSQNQRATLPIQAPTAPVQPTLPVQAPTLPARPTLPAPPSAPVSDPAIASAPMGAPAPLVLPAAPMGELQQTLDGAPLGATVRLPRGEYRGPITLARALTIEGAGAVIWARTGPVVRVESEGVVLRGVQIEVTDAEPSVAHSDVALWVAGAAPTLQNVGVRGRVVGVAHEAEREWRLPASLDLGAFAPRALNSWVFAVEVPVECRLQTGISGLQIKPAQLGAGVHQVEIVASNIGPDTFLAGQIEVEHGGIVRRIPLSGRASDAGLAPVQNKQLASDV